MTKPGYEKRRILYVGPVGIGVGAAVAAVVFLVAGEVVRTLGSARTFEWSGVIWGTVAALVAGVIAAFAFNLIAPMIGGIPLWLEHEPEDAARNGAADEDS